MEDLSCPETTTLSAAELVNVLQRVTGGLSVSTKPQGGTDERKRKCNNTA